MSQNAEMEFAPGSEVVYGMQGKFSVVSIESRNIAGNSISFYKLEKVRNLPFKAKKPDPAIFVPVLGAGKKGMRLPLSADQVHGDPMILSSKEYYFPLVPSPQVDLAKLDAVQVSEGIVGLAKVVSYLTVVKKREIVPASHAMKYLDQAMKQLIRELCDSTEKTSKVVEEEITKLLKAKPLFDQ